MTKIFWHIGNAGCWCVSVGLRGYGAKLDGLLYRFGNAVIEVELRHLRKIMKKEAAAVTPVQ